MLLIFIPPHDTYIFHPVDSDLGCHTFPDKTTDNVLENASGWVPFFADVAWQASDGLATSSPLPISSPSFSSPSFPHAILALYIKTKELRRHNGVSKTRFCPSPAFF